MLINLLKTINRHNQRVPIGTLYITRIFFIFIKTLSIDFISIYNLHEGIEENPFILQQKEKKFRYALRLIKT